MRRKKLNRLIFKVTTHEGFYSPCDDECCVEVRRALRREFRPWWRRWR